MLVQKLSFGTIIKIAPNIAEVVVDHEILMNIDMVIEYHDWILKHLSDPCMLLINKLNSYSYDFDAQMKLGTLEKIKAIAMVVYDRAALNTMELSIDLPNEIERNIEIFSSRDMALAWLEKQG